MAIGVAAAALGGAAIGGASDVFGTLYSASQTRRLTRHARKFQIWLLQNQYQMTVKDLEAAGLNPALAYMKGPTGAVGLGQQTAAAARGGGVAAGMQAATSAVRARDEVKNLKVQRETMEWQQMAFRAASARDVAQADLSNMKKATERQRLVGEALKAQWNIDNPTLFKQGHAFEQTRIGKIVTTGAKVAK